MRRLVLRFMGFPVLTLEVEGEPIVVEDDATEDDDDQHDPMTVSASHDKADVDEHQFGFWSPASDPGYVEDKTKGRKRRA